MSLLAPLGLLGLLGIAALIIIYILRPNYQTKMVSSTYVWQLSLRYKKKSIPISFLRSLLILLCQILIITACAILMAQPVIEAEVLDYGTEKIAIIDASGSMLSSNEGETRFSRAVSQVEELAQTVTGEGGRITVILAGTEAQVLVQRYGADMLDAALDELDAAACSYGAGDVEGAISLAEEVLALNPYAEVLLYTGTTYIDTGTVTVVDVSSEDEWNVAILDAEAYTEENFYRFDIDVVCYGRSRDVTLSCYIYDANDGYTFSYSFVVRCENDNVTTFTFNPAEYGEEIGVFSYSSVYFSVSENDSLSYDNTYYLYGGQKTTIRIQYFSSASNSFLTTFLVVLRNNVGNVWDIDLDTVTSKSEMAVEGYDFYIFEHTMPDEVPTDGVVLLFDPDTTPAGAGFTLGSTVTDYGDDGKTGVYLTAGEDHEVMQYVNVEGIQVSRYTEVAGTDGYTELMYCNDSPVMLLKNTQDEKVVLFTFGLNYSTLAMLAQFPLLMYNIFNYYFPTTFSDSDGDMSYVYDVYDNVTLNARGASLAMSGAMTATYTEFPVSLQLTAPGVYTFQQTLISGEMITENFYVKLSSVQSNIFLEVDSLTSPYVEAIEEQEDEDLMIYFAIAMVALLFVEWMLQAKENF